MTKLTKEIKEYLKPDSAYEQERHDFYIIEGYEEEYYRKRLLEDHTWGYGKSSAIPGVKRYICKLCGAEAFGLSIPEKFLDNEWKKCLSDEEKMVKDIIE